MLVQIVVDIGVVAFCDTEGLLESRMGFQDVFEKLPGGRLSTFGHPVFGDQDVAVRTPDTFDEDWLWGHGDVAGRGSSDGG